LHKEISKKIEESNAQYKSYVDLHRRQLEFNEGDHVMIRIRPERFPPGAVKKLTARSADPFKSLRKLIQMPLYLIYLQTSGLVRHLIHQIW